MVNQAQMNGRRGERRAGTVLRRNVSELLHDVIELGELQIRLLAVDVSEARGRSVLPVVLILAGLILALGTIPVALLSIAWGLAALAGISEGGGAALTAVGALLLAGGAAWWGWRKLRSAMNTLSRSRIELANNIAWIKDALKQRHPAEGEQAKPRPPTVLKGMATDE